VGATPLYGFPYPELTDTPNGPAQIQSLASAVETRIQTVARVGRIGGKRYIGGATVALAINLAAESVCNIDSGSLSLIGGRSYKIHAMVRIRATGTAGDVILRLRDNSLAGTARGFRNLRLPVLTTIYEYEMTGLYDCVTSESKAFILTSQAQAGNGVDAMAGDGQVPVVVEVIDAGPITLTSV
jgi:hypothetical protein